MQNSQDYDAELTTMTELIIAQPMNDFRKKARHVAE